MESYRQEIERKLNLEVVYHEVAGITESSKNAVRKLVPDLPKPTAILLIYDDGGYPGDVQGGTWDFLTYVILPRGVVDLRSPAPALRFDGFSWGYSGEGPRGLRWLLDFLGFELPKELPPAHKRGAWILTPIGECQPV